MRHWKPSFDRPTFPSSSVRDERTELSLYVQVKQADTDYLNARISNISVSGFKLNCFAKLLQHKSLFIQIPGLQLLGAQIRWYEDGVYGCQFNSSLHPSVFDHLQRKLNGR